VRLNQSNSETHAERLFTERMQKVLHNSIETSTFSKVKFKNACKKADNILRTEVNESA